MQKNKFKIALNKPVAESTYKMLLSPSNVESVGNLKITPGQFVNISIPGKYLARPISIAGWDGNQLMLFYKVVGEGTYDMSHLVEGEELEILLPLGHGFDEEKCFVDNKIAKEPLLIGGGVGVPPMMSLAEEFLKKGVKPTVILGFGTAHQVFGIEEFRKLGEEYGVKLDPMISTMDGSMGTRGMVVDVIDKIYSFSQQEAEHDFEHGNKNENVLTPYIFACGPRPMLKALTELPFDGQYSFEARMACGFGACMGCTCETMLGYKRVCKDGPVFYKEEIKW